MEEKDKPTVEEMIAAYRQHCRRIEEACCQYKPVRMDFSALPLNRRMMVAGWLRMVAAALAVVSILFVLVWPVSDVYAESLNTAHTDEIEIVKYMLKSRLS